MITRFFSNLTIALDVMQQLSLQYQFVQMSTIQQLNQYDQLEDHYIVLANQDPFFFDKNNY